MSKGLPAAPLPCPHPPQRQHRAGRERKMRRQFPSGWREAAELCPSKPSGRGAGSPAPIWESGEQNPSPLHLRLPAGTGVVNTEAESLPTPSSPALCGSNSSSLHHQVCTAHHKMLASCQLNKHSCLQILRAGPKTDAKIERFM